MGINDFSNYQTLDSVFARYCRIINIIKSVSPATDIVIQSATPTRPLHKEIPELNKQLYQYCKHNNIRYVDIYTPLFKNKGLDSNLTYDGVHLNGNGYEIWINKITNLVN